MGYQEDLRHLPFHPPAGQQEFIMSVGEFCNRQVVIASPEKEKRYKS
jgi:hypothetical protein